MREKQKDIFLFWTGLLGAFQFRFIGTFYGVEIIAFFSYFFISWKTYRKSSETKKFLKMSFLWLLGSIVANLWNGVETELALKGIFNIVFFIMQIPFVYWALNDKLSRWIYFYTGYAISTVLNFYFLRVESIVEGDISIWMFYAWTQFVVAIAAILYYKGFHKLSYITAVGLGLYGLFNGSRNMFLTLALASIILLFIDRIKAKDITNRVSKFKKKFTMLAITLAIGAVMVSNSYEYLASNGILGDAAYEKYMVQKYSQMGLASGRADFVIGAEFIVRNPIIGYGSFAKDKEELRPKLCEKYGVEYSERLAAMNGFVVPCHSVLVGQWNWHGVLAGVFWLYYLLLIYKSFKKGIFLHEPRIMGLGIYVSIMILWDILFSPMAARIPYIFYFIYLILLHTNLKSTNHKRYDKNFYHSPFIQSGTIS